MNKNIPDFLIEHHRIMNDIKSRKKKIKIYLFVFLFLSLAIGVFEGINN